jgi:hypothetical protein
MTEAKSDKAKIPAEVAELDARISRLRNRLKAGDEDMTPDDLMGKEITLKPTKDRLPVARERPQSRGSTRSGHQEVAGALHQ